MSENKLNTIVRRFSFVALLIVLLFFTTSVLLNSLAEKFVIYDKFSQAEVLYKVSKILNPLNKKADVGIKIVQVLKEERKGESEETNFENTIAKRNEDSLVLGANVTVPVLMYHYIRVNPNPSDKVGWNLSVTPDNFNKQMNYLASNGYHTITLDELGAALFNKAQLPSKPVVITLDDGYKDAYTQALPILKSHGLKAIDFVITGFVGGPNFLSWSDIREMKDSGVFTFGSHTVNHVALTYGSNESIAYEVTQSKNELQNNLGTLVNWLAYPYGIVDERVTRFVSKVGYVGAFGTNFGSSQSTDFMYRLPRVRVGGGDTAATLSSRLPY